MGKNLERFNKWCAFGAICPDDIGRLLIHSKQTGEILYSEGQMYRPEFWDMNYVKIFETLEEVILFLIDDMNQVFSEIKEDAERKFPSYKKDVDWNKLSRYYISKRRNLRYSLKNGIET